MSNTQVTVLGIFFIFFMTTAGSATVLLFKKGISYKLNSLFLGVSCGIMVAASIWSLILPALDGSAQLGRLNFLPVAIGLALGGCFLVILDGVAAKVGNILTKGDTAINPNPLLAIHKYLKLFFAVTLHNIPEGLAVGFAFGVAATTGEPAAIVSALGLAVGIGIQNFPEGAAVSIPMLSISNSRSKAFLYGTASGAVEPIFATIGYFLASYIAVLQPWLLAFSAGAMLFVVAEDLLPNAKHSSCPHLSTWGFMVGFIIMMTLDVALS